MDKYKNFEDMKVSSVKDIAYQQYIELLYLIKTEPNDSELGRKVRELFKK